MILKALSYLFFIVFANSQNYQFAFQKSIVSQECSDIVANSNSATLPSIYDSSTNSYVTSGCIINCSNSPSYMFKSIILKSNQIYQKTITIPDPHYQMILSATFIAIDGYSLTTSNLSVQINSVLQTGQLTLSSSSATNYCEGSSNDNIYTYVLPYAHTDTTNSIVIQNSGSNYQLAIKGLDIIYGKCGEGCQSCTDSVTCTQCNAKSSMTPGQKCISQCASNQFKSSSACVNCNISCKTCFGSNSDNCTSCNSGYYVNDNFQCVLGCSNTSYIANDLFNTCITYNSSTSKCSAKTSNKCSTCKSSYYLSNTNCASSISDCPSGYYYQTSSNSCVIIPTVNCQMYDQTKSRCTMCNSGYYVQKTDYSCKQPTILDVTHIIAVDAPTDYYKDTNTSGYYIPCHSTCLTCSGPTRYECLTCSGTKTLLGGECIQTCGSAQYFNEPTGTCISCDSKCSSCNGPSSSECITCATGKFKFGSSQCVNSCPQSYYADSNNVCQACLQNCYACSNGTSCSTCNSSFFLLQNNQCVTTCPDEYFNDTVNNKCVSCLSNCKQCSNNSSCSSCNDGYYLYNGNQCLSNCPSKYYKNTTTKACSQCLNKCETCSNSTTCTACTNDGTQYYLHQNSQCVNPCPAPYVNDAQHNCKQANCTDSNCTSCDQSNLSKCQICASNYYLQPVGFANSYTCQLTCPSGYFKDIDHCTQCFSNCQNCSDSSTCNTCSSGYFLLSNNQCVLTCPNEYFNDTSNNKCTNCLSHCKQCNDNSSCSLCNDGYYLYNGNQCLTNCPSKYYENSSTKACSQCLNKCESCNDGNTCVTCTNDGTQYYLHQNNQCLNPCPTSYINDANNHCILAVCTDPNCTSCDQSDLSKCQTCSPNYYLQPAGQANSYTCQLTCPSGYFKDTNHCTQCFNHCSDCNDSSTCNTCSSGYLLLSNNQCVTTCPNEYFKDTTNNKCISCLSNCKQCNDNSSCQQCNDGYYLYNGNQCLNNCPSKFYNNTTTKECSSCLNKCEICNDDTTCQQCINDGTQYYLHQNSQCINPCPATYTNDSNNVCKQANCTDPNCTSCDQSQLSKCQICAPNYFLQPAGFSNSYTCQLTCPSGYFQDTDHCTQCFSHCSDCNDSLSCNTCESSYIALMDSNNIDACIDQSACTQNYYLDIPNSQCRKCKVNQCSKCSSSDTVCDKCQNGFSLYNNICLTTCPDGYYSNQVNNANICSQCSSVINFCELCQNSNSCNKCQNGYFKQSQISCTDTCPDGYKGDYGTRECQKLNIDYCIKYEKDQCVQCVAPQFKIDNNQCILNCPQYQNPNYILGNCDPIQCPSPLYLYNLQCLDQCPQNTIPNESTRICYDIANKTFNIEQVSGQNIVNITFDKQFIVNLNSITNNIKITFDQKMDYTYTIEQVSNSQYQIKFQLSNNPPQNIKLTVSFTGLQSQDGNKGLSLSPSSQEASVTLTFPISETQKVVSQAIADTTKSISQSVVVSSFSLIFTSQFQLLSTLVELTEIFYLTLFIDILKPSNLQNFLIAFQDVSMQFIYNPFEQINGSFSFQKSYSTFDQNKYSSFYLDNAGSLYSIVFGVLFIHLLLIGLKFILRNHQKNIIAKGINKTIHILSHGTYFEVLQITYLQFVFSTILNMVNIQNGSYMEKLNIFFISITFLFVFPIPFVLYYLHKKQKYVELIQEFCGHSQYPEYSLLLYIRKLVFSVVIVGGYGHAFVQISFLLIPSILLVIYIIKKQPFKKKMANIKNVILESLFLLSVSVYLLLVDEEVFSEENRINVAWAMIGSFVIIIAFEMITLIVNIVKQTINLIKYLRNMKFNKNRVYPETLNLVGENTPGITTLTIADGKFETSQGKQFKLNEETKNFQLDYQSCNSNDLQALSTKRGLRRKKQNLKTILDSFGKIAQQSQSPKSFITNPDYMKTSNTFSSQKSKFKVQFVFDSVSQKSDLQDF